MKREGGIGEKGQPPGGVHGEKGRRQMLLARKDIHGDRLPFEAEQPHRQPNLVAPLVELVIVEKQRRHQFISAATPATAGPSGRGCSSARRTRSAKTRKRLLPP